MLLELNGISKRFPGVQALSDVSLDLAAGEVHAVVGENGAGKSTLMKILGGVHRMDSGEIRIEGRPTDIGSPHDALDLGISVIHQELSLMPDLTIAENIYLGRERRHLGFFIDDAELNRRTAALFERLGIGLDPRARVDGATVAQQQVVEIAKALSFDARILVMDEPTAALTEAETRTLFGLIRDLRRHGTGIIYISHRLEELEAIAGRITVLRDGALVDTRSAADVELREVISMMVGRNVRSPRELEHRGAGAGTTSATLGRPVLEVHGLSTNDLLTDVGFELHAGEILGFAGLMGAGRTEVARAIVGADPIERGTILLDGRHVHIGSPADAVRLGIGYLSEDRKRFGLMLDQDVGFNIVISALADHTDPLGFVQRALVRRTATEQVEALRIKTPSLQQHVINLSGGNQQKVVIAKWLARNCDILIFDEPTRGIDVGAKEEIYHLLDGLADSGKSIIMISSELPEILRMSHRILVMCDGRVAGVVERVDANAELLMSYATGSGPHGGIAA